MKSDMSDFEPVFTIGTTARLLSIAVQTLRMYEQEGLVLPHKTPGGHRMYSARDMERLKCIRKLISEDGLNISGIKHLMALVPCWQYKGGLDDDCRNCRAYYETIGPCWNLEEPGAKCRAQDCRSCEVYRLRISCERMKMLLFGHQRPEKTAKA
ncbi:MAG: MerR family transcriptional regulator [Calditrichia bacterium]